MVSQILWVSSLGHSLVGSSIRLQSRCRLDCILIWRFDWGIIHFQAYSRFCENPFPCGCGSEGPSFFPLAGGQLSSQKSPIAPRDCFYLPESSSVPSHVEFPNMAANISKPARGAYKALLLRKVKQHIPLPLPYSCGQKEVTGPAHTPEEGITKRFEHQAMGILWSPLESVYYIAC